MLLMSWWPLAREGVLWEIGPGKGNGSTGNEADEFRNSSNGSSTASRSSQGRNSEEAQEASGNQGTKVHLLAGDNPENWMGTPPGGR